MYKEVEARDQKPGVLCKKCNHLTTVLVIFHFEAFFGVGLEALAVKFKQILRQSFIQSLLILTQKTPRKSSCVDVDPEIYCFDIDPENCPCDFIVHTAWKVPTFIFLVRSAAQTISYKIEIKLFSNSESVTMESAFTFCWTNTSKFTLPLSNPISKMRNELNFKT